VSASLLAAGLALAMAPPPATPDHDYRRALDLLYDGASDAARERLAALTRDSGDDPLGAALEALAVCWTLEQKSDSTSLDKDLERRVARAVALANVRLARDPADARARLARGAAHGVSSRYHLFRLHERDASRAAVRMREDLLAVQKQDPASRDARFGLGLYDYYVDVLPRMVKVLRFFLGMPGGNRARGLREIEDGQQSFLYDVEAQAQLYEIHAFYEHHPDRALGHIQGLHRRYPGWPLWGLKLAEHQRDRLGLYGASAAVARGLLEAEEKHGRGEGIAAALARLSLGESLLLDGRTAEARQALLPLRQGPSAHAGQAAGAALLLGRSLELEGDREGAVAHYRAAADGPDRGAREAARRALRQPLGAAEIKGGLLVAQARRARESGQFAESSHLFRAALAAWPASREAALRVAQDDLEHGRIDQAAAAADRLRDAKDVQPPWVAAAARLLQARLLDLAGRREEARAQYRLVEAEPIGQEELQRQAAEGLRRPYRLGLPSPQPSS
jgi:Arc/MetJ-type ribon-helix-helix transcriptional regulator